MDINCSYQKLVPIEQMVAHPSNANKHGKQQIEMLAKIMKYQGWRHPIVVSSLSGFIVAGHGRLAAAKLNGWTECPVDTQSFVDKVQEIAFLYSDNKISELAEHDDELMRLGALELKLDNGFDLDLLGVPDLDLSVPDPDKEATEDDVPDPTKSVSVLGDIYELGEHRLMCGDSTSIDAVEKLMNGEKADMVFTDPPYGMNLDTNYKDSRQKGEDASLGNLSGKPRKHKNYSPVIGDDEDFDPGIIFGIFDYCKEVFLWGADYYCQRLPKGGGWLVWDKTGGNDSLMDAGYGSNFELCWSKTPHKRDIARVTYKGVAGMKKEDGSRIHPTQKSVSLCEWFIDRWSITGNAVVDLFGGSGSTLIACEKTKRKCFMMELDPHYVDVIVSRYVKYSGKTSIKRNGEPMEWTI